MTNQSRRFVDDQQAGVFVEDGAHLDTATNKVASFRKERRIYPAGHSMAQARCRMNAAFPSQCPGAPWMMSNRFSKRGEILTTKPTIDQLSTLNSDRSRAGIQLSTNAD
jgi:hypothetical protein